MRQQLIPSLFLLFLAYGCDGGSGGSRDGGTGGGSGDESWANVHPPASIDIKSCYSIVDDSTDAIWDTCDACCSSAGFSASGFINQDHCTCGKSESVACPTKTTTGDECSTCCENNGYFWNMWTGGGTTSTCTCSGKEDPLICAIALKRKDPSDQCSLCCLNNGFLGSMYVGIGTPDCTCTSP